MRVMARLHNFDYTSPFYYLVTMVAKKGTAPLSILTDANRCGYRSTRVTSKFKAVFYWLNHRAYAHRMQISHYIIMPNHIHFMVKIADAPPRLSLFEVVQKLYSTLSQAYYDALNQPKGDLIFEPEWHDWVVLKAHQLDAFIRYIQTNPHRTRFRLTHAPACLPHHSATPDGQTWTAIGTCTIRDTPVRAPIICSRQIQEGTPLWERWRTFAQRLGPGCIAIGTFMSPCEKMVRDEVLKAGGNIIRLLPEGIPPKGHPSHEDEPLCAAGRLTLLTPFPYSTHRPSNQTLHDRCHTTLHTIARRWQRNITELPPSTPDAPSGRAR